MSSDFTLMAFPVVDPRFIGNHSWTFINADAVGNASPAVLFAVTLTPLFLATQMVVKMASLTSIFAIHVNFSP
jgi:hypothetical protein